MKKRKRFRRGDVITLSVCTILVTSVMVLSIFQIHRHYHIHFHQVSEAAFDESTNLTPEESTNNSAAGGQSVTSQASAAGGQSVTSQASAAGGQSVTSQASATGGQTPTATRNYQVKHQERLNDGIHTTNENQRNGALEDIMRSIAEQTAG